jgi:hypothetical protein
MRQVLSWALARSPGLLIWARARLASFCEAGYPVPGRGCAHGVTGAGVTLVRQHDQPGRREFAQDAPDPGGGQVVHGAGQGPGHPDGLAVGEWSLAMIDAGHDVLRCAYPGCENEPRLGEAGAAAEPRYCGLPDPVMGEPHTALTAFRRRQVLVQQGGGMAEPKDDAQRRQRAEADAGEARAAALEADARLTEALAAKAAAEQEAVATQDCRGTAGR